MRVLVFSIAPMEKTTGSGIRARLIAEGLRRNGVEVGVFTPGFPASFPLLGITGFPAENHSPYRQQVVAAGKQFKPDILLGVTEGYADEMVAAAQALQCPAAFDIHGIGVVEILELGWGHGPIFKRTRYALRWLRAMRFARLITVANPTLLPVARRLFRSVEPLVGMTDISHFTPEGAACRLGKNPANTQILYAGNFMKWQGIDLLFRAMRMLLCANEPFEFTLLGSFARRQERMKRWMRGIPADAIHFLDGIPFDHVPEYYRGADALVIPRPFMFSTHLAFPQKLVDYMASGSLIVATDLAPHRWAFETPPCGILCKRTPRGLAEGLRQTRDCTRRQEYTRNARHKAVQSFCHLKQTRRLADLLEKTLRSA